MRHDEPLVSICIPTHNRSRYLESLLDGLLQQLAAFPYAYEIVIADNASPDATADVVHRYAERLPIRAFRHERNIGGFPNWQFVMSQALGRYLVYLSDDDCLLGEPLAATIARLEADPAVVAVYAPWLLYDLVAQREQGQFYRVPGDLRIERGAHRELLDHVLRHHIFPEVQIVRREALQRLQPRINPHAFCAFVHAADYLAQGPVLIQQQPWYVAITRYFDDETRDQLGSEEVEVAWDRYRGGLEYLLARAGDSVTPEERSGLHVRMQRFVALRMSVAIRMRHHKQRDPIDTWMLAMRLRGLGYEALCPVPLATLGGAAALHFLLHDVELHRGIRRIVAVGAFDDETRRYLEQHAAQPLEFVADAPPLDRLADTLVLMRDGCPPPAWEPALAARRNVRLVREHDAMARFAA